MKRAFRSVVAMLVVGSLSGCAALFLEQRDPELGKAADLFLKKNYPEALQSYQQIISRKASPAKQAEARYSIALILSSHDNPKKNYTQALEAFDEFLKLYPDHERAQEAANWKNALKTLLDEKRECEQLKKNIEELKQLDIRHEEKRKRK